MVLPTFRHKSYARLTKNEREPREPERFRAERVSRKRDLDIDWERNFPPLVFIIHGCICCKNEMDETKEKGSEIVPMINVSRNVTNPRGKDRWMQTECAWIRFA